MTKNWKEVLLVVGLTALAGFIRVFNIEGLPAGLHGDEAITGLEGMRILREGWIGSYSYHAIGQPAGTLYPTAISVWLLGNTILSLRLISVLLGTVTIPVLYVVVRRSFGIRVALIASLLLATLNWEVHYSRLAFPLIGWPLTVAVAVGTLTEAIKKNTPRWWAMVGLASGLGIYVYNAHLFLVGLLSLFIACYVWKRRRIAPGAIFTVTLLLAGLPMIMFAAGPANSYFSHFNEAGLFTRDYWQAIDAVEKVMLVSDRYRDWWEIALHKGYLDEVDSIGLTPVIGVPIMLLAATGMIISLKRYRSEPLATLGFLIVALLPFAAVSTVGAYARRTLPMALFLCMFAGIAVEGLLGLPRAHSTRHKLYKTLAGIGLTICITFIVFQNLFSYFGVFGSTENQRNLNAREFTDAVKIMRQLGPGHCFYFMSGQWSVNYEVRQYLVPAACSEDRSAEFGRFDLGLNNPREGKAVFLLLDRYRSLLKDLQELYPGGKVIYGPERDPTFVAYEVGE